MFSRGDKTHQFIIIFWLVLVYGLWLGLVFIGGEFHELVEHWPISVAMALGSYFAGSTPMGGGTVGFPVLTLILGEEPSLGRDFSFAIQSVGMVSASVFIFCLSHPIAGRFLKWAVLGSTLGTPLGILFISPYVPGFGIQIFFAILWAGFGVLHIWKLNEFSSYSDYPKPHKQLELRYGLATGFFSSLLISSVLGVGIDLALYAIMVLVFRSDLRLAIPTSVILMAYTSVLGSLTQSLSGGIDPEVYGYWLAASPIVAIGAPLGAIIVKKMGRKSTMWIVSVLCLLQFIWTMIREWERLQLKGVFLSMASVFIFFALFYTLYRTGKSITTVDSSTED